MNKLINQSLISVIIPTYNRNNLIEEALESVKSQTYRPIEIILIDDGSTDNTGYIVRKWAEQYEEINELFLHYYYQQNAGAGAARNYGIQEISGEYVQFLDSDDIIHTDRFQRLVETFEKEQCDFIQTGFNGIDSETGKVIQTIFGRPNENQLELALKGYLWANTLRSAFTTELIRRLDPWNTQMTCFEDREYVERAVVHAKKACAIKDVLASARRGGSERISDRLRSYEGRTWRIYSERCLAEGVKDRTDISNEAKQAFASRIYALGFRSNASGWADLGKQCGEIANSMDVELDSLGMRRKLVWKMGRLGGLFYQWLSGIKNSISG